jgi:solute carrier family 25 phosphate transporter 3
LSQVPYTVVQLSSYETLTTAVYSALDAAGLGSEAAGAWRYVISAGCAVVAAVLSSLASQPGDTLLSAVNKSAKTAAAALGADGAAGRPQGPLAVMGATINELGVAGLFKGTKARLVHVTVIVVTQLLVYDFIKSLCGLPATGQH